MIARHLGEAARRRGELVPEAIEIDALAAGDEALHVRPTESKVPQQRILENLVPGAHPRQGSIDQDEPSDPLRMLHGEGIAHHVTDVVSDETGAFDL